MPPKRLKKQKQVSNLALKVENRQEKAQSKKQKKAKDDQSNQQQRIKIGKIIFKPQTPASIISLTEKLKAKINLNGFRWNFKNKVFSAFSVLEIFKWFQQTSINHLQLSQDQNPLILNSLLINDSFMKLKVLKVQKNFITNIQDLQLLNAPILEWISFRQNHISSVQVLAKCVFPNLALLYLDQNPLKTVIPLNRAQLSKLYTIDGCSNPLLPDIYSLNKCNHHQIEDIYFWNGQIVAFKKQKQILKKRFQLKYVKIAPEGEIQGSDNQSDQIQIQNYHN